MKTVGSAPPPIANSAQPVSTPREVKKAQKAKTDAVTDGVEKQPLPSTKVDSSALQMLRALGASNAGVTEALARYEDLAQMWGAQAPLAKAAPLLGTTLASLENRKTFGTQVIASEKGGIIRLAQKPAFSNVLPQIFEKEMTQFHAPTQLTQVAPAIGRITTFLRAPATDHETQTATSEVAESNASDVVTEQAIVGLGAESDGSSEGGEPEPELELDAVFGTNTEADFASMALQLGMDISSLVQIVMTQCSQDAARDMREMFIQIRENNAKKKESREHIAAQRSRSSEIEKTLRTEYDRRCGLSPDDPEHVAAELTNFDAFKLSQRIVPSAQNGWVLSPNKTHYPQPAKKYYDAEGQEISEPLVDRARKLGVEPAVAAELHAYYGEHKAELVRFESFDHWLLSSKEVGGAGLAIEPTSDQSDAVSQALQKPETLLANKYGLTGDASQKLVDWWDGLASARKVAFGHSMEKWLTERPPLGPGLPATKAVVDPTTIDTAFASYNAEKALIDLGDRYKTGYGPIAAALHYWKSDVRGLTFEMFLIDVCGFVEGDARNRSLLETSLAKWSDIASTPDALAQKAIWDAEIDAPHEAWKARNPAAEGANAFTAIPSVIDVSGSSPTFDGIKGVIDVATNNDGPDLQNIVVPLTPPAEEVASAPPPEPEPSWQPFMTWYESRASSEARSTTAAAQQARSMLGTTESKTTFVIGAVDTSAAMMANIKELKAPIDKTLKQPPRQKIDGEKTHADLEADAGILQAKYDSLGDMSQEQAIKMQIYQGRYAKMMEALSNLMKSMGDTKQNIVGNLK